MPIAPLQRRTAIGVIGIVLAMPSLHASAGDTSDAPSFEEQKREFDVLRAPREKLAPSRRIYDRSTVETITGTVMHVDRMPGRRGNVFAQLNVKTATETIGVFLGPERWVAEQPVKIAVGDAITVTGSRIKFRQHPLVLAAEVKKGEATLALRDANGMVKWPPPGPSLPSNGMSTEDSEE